MPIYDYQCMGECGTVENVTAHMDEPYLTCPKCGRAPAKRLFSPPTSKHIGDLEPYLDENMGPTPVWITSRAHKAEELKRRGLIMKRSIGDGTR
jgi:putative FmdB family regulatory protein